MLREVSVIRMRWVLASSIDLSISTGEWLGLIPPRSPASRER